MSNPIISVDGQTIPCPSSYQYVLQDVSAPNAGRTEDGMMDKQRVGQVVGLNLQWVNFTTDVGSRILKAFDPEYITVDYLDLKHGGYVKREFYVGDRTAPAYNTELGLWSSLSLNIMFRDGGQIV